MNNPHDIIPDHTTESATPPARDNDAPPAWEMIEPGRYQPKRTRGSCLGRELG
jgi:hypothetical protein